METIPAWRLNYANSVRKYWLAFHEIENQEFEELLFASSEALIVLMV